MSRWLEVMTSLRDDDCCYVKVWVKDTFRYTGRGKSGFEMHYNKRQCSRRKTHGNRCWQHKEKNL